MEKPMEIKREAAPRLGKTLRPDAAGLLFSRTINSRLGINASLSNGGLSNATAIRDFIPQPNWYSKKKFIANTPITKAKHHLPKVRNRLQVNDLAVGILV